MNSNLHLRKIDQVLLARLKHKASTENVSLNSVILTLLKQSLGLESSKKSSTHHDLDELAGTWSKKDADKFKTNTAAFEKIDKDIWK